MEDDKQSLYDVLGLTAESSQEEIKAAYRRLAMQYHPDRLHGLTQEGIDEARVRFDLIQKAYDLLSDPASAPNMTVPAASVRRRRSCPR